MVLEPWMFSVVLIPVITAAIQVGDHRRQMASNRERQDERHAENQKAMGELKDDVKDVRTDVKGLRDEVGEVRVDVQRINGQVAANKETLNIHASEIRRLRDV